MNVQTIQMDQAEARERLRAYRGELHRGADAEYEAAVAGYEALAEGTPVIQYGAAIRNAPRDEKGRPMLAVARADRRQAEFRWDGTTGRFSTLLADPWAYRHRHPDGLLVRSVDMRERHPDRWIRGYALVPMVPPHALRAAGGRSQLSRHLILWEVEEWSDSPLQAIPDRDPYLLRPIHGDLCAVVAEWDLTDLERAVMAARARR